MINIIAINNGSLKKRVILDTSDMCIGSKLMGKLRLFRFSLGENWTVFYEVIV